MINTSPSYSLTRPLTAASNDNQHSMTMGAGRWRSPWWCRSPFWRLLIMCSVAMLQSQFMQIGRNWIERTLNATEAESSAKWGLAVSAFSIGQIAGTVISCLYGDCIGRRCCLVVCSIVNSLVVIARDKHVGVLLSMCTVVDSYLLLVLPRVVIGIGNGVAINASVLIIAESAPKRSRGAFLGLQEIYYTTGHLLAVVATLPELLGTERLWQLAMGLACLAAPMCTIIILCCPDSPRHLFLTKQMDEKAVAAIRFYQGDDNVDETLHDLFRERHLQLGSEGSLMEMITNRHLRRPLVLLLLLGVGTQLGGTNIVAPYSTFIFAQFGIGPSSGAYWTLALTLLPLLTSLLLPTFVERAGRRPVLLCGLGLCGVCFMATGAMPWLPSMNQGAVVALLASIKVFTAVQFGAVATLYGELLHQKYRAKGMAIARIASYVVGSGIGFGFLPITHRFGVLAPMVAMGVVCITFTLIFSVVVPETKGLTFEQIYHLYYDDTASTRPQSRDVHVADVEQAASPISNGSSNDDN